MKLVYVASHPIQYHAPLFRELALRCEFEAWFGHEQTARQQGSAGYGVDFDWDVDLLEGYRYRYLQNISPNPNTSDFGGIDAPELESLMTQVRPDAVVAGGWNQKFYWQAVDAGRRRSIPVHVRSDSHAGERPAWQILLRRLFHGGTLRRFSGVIAAGSRSAEYSRRLGMPATRIAIVPPCVDRTRFEAAARVAFHEAAAFRAEIEVAPHAKLVLFVGRLLRSKRCEDVLRACATAGSAWVPVIVGRGESEGRLRALASALGVPARFLGFVNQSRLPRIYAACDVLALPSERETWGMVVHEALAAGLPCVVSSKVGSAPDLARYAPAVQVFAPGDVTALADLLRAAVDLKTSVPMRASVTRAVEDYSPAAAAAAMLGALGRFE